MFSDRSADGAHEAAAGKRSPRDHPKAGQLAMAAAPARLRSVDSWRRGARPENRSPGVCFVGVDVASYAVASGWSRQRQHRIALAAGRGPLLPTSSLSITTPITTDLGYDELNVRSR